MDEKINQAINNLQTIANLAIDDDVIAKIARDTVVLLGEYAAQHSLHTDAVYCTCTPPFASSIYSPVCQRCGKVTAPVS